MLWVLVTVAVFGLANFAVGLYCLAAWRALEARREAHEKAQAKALEAALREHREAVERVVALGVGRGGGGDVRH